LWAAQSGQDWGHRTAACVIENELFVNSGGFRPNLPFSRFGRTTLRGLLLGVWLN